MTSCAVTGHRPQKFPWGYNEEDRRCAALKSALTSQIEELVRNGITDFLSGMAEGVDTWAALAVLSLREQHPSLKLHCILPCRNQAEKWSIPAQESYRSILEQADSIIYVSREERKGCMLERNRFLVAHAELLLAVGSLTGRSGTAATVRYAQKLRRRILVIDPVSQQATYLQAVQGEPNTELDQPRELNNSSLTPRWMHVWMKLAAGYTAGADPEPIKTH